MIIQDNNIVNNNKIRVIAFIEGNLKLILNPSSFFLEPPLFASHFYKIKNNIK